jgi:serine/threonine-protein kinase RsbW
MATPITVKLALSSQVKLIDLIHSASEKMAESVGFSADDALNIGLAVREAAINAIVHGNKEDPEKMVDVTLTANGESLEATVRDYGAGFDPDAAPDPTDAEHLLMTSGRGLLLIRAFVDEAEFERMDVGMQIRMSKRIEQPTSEDSSEDSSEDTSEES